MEHSRSGLFALHVASLAPQARLVKPVGKYDPTEQLWRDDGLVVACIDPSGYVPCMDECTRYLPAHECNCLCCYNKPTC